MRLLHAFCVLCAVNVSASFRGGHCGSCFGCGGFCLGVHFVAFLILVVQIAYHSILHIRHRVPPKGCTIIFRDDNPQTNSALGAKIPAKRESPSVLKR